jgi:hypothetical protein
MKKMIRWWVDLPDVNLKEPGNDNAYINVGTFDTRKEALKWLEDVHGMPSRIASFFITKGAI